MLSLKKHMQEHGAANFCLVNPQAKKGKQHSKLLDISFLRWAQALQGPFQLSIEVEREAGEGGCSFESSKAQTISIRGMSKICSLALHQKISFFVQGSSFNFFVRMTTRQDEERTSLEIDPPLWSWRKFILLPFVSRLWASIVSSDALLRYLPE